VTGIKSESLTTFIGIRTFGADSLQPTVEKSLPMSLFSHQEPAES
jgi:hypothetical protein